MPNRKIINFDSVLIGRPQHVELTGEFNISFLNARDIARIAKQGVNDDKIYNIFDFAAQGAPQPDFVALEKQRQADGDRKIVKLTPKPTPEQLAREISGLRDLDID